MSRNEWCEHYLQPTEEFSFAKALRYNWEHCDTFQNHHGQDFADICNCCYMMSEKWRASQRSRLRVWWEPSSVHNECRCAGFARFCMPSSVSTLWCGAPLEIFLEAVQEKLRPLSNKHALREQADNTMCFFKLAFLVWLNLLDSTHVLRRATPWIIRHLSSTALNCNVSNGSVINTQTQLNRKHDRFVNRCSFGGVQTGCIARKGLSSRTGHFLLDLVDFPLETQWILVLGVVVNYDLLVVGLWFTCVELWSTLLNCDLPCPCFCRNKHLGRS